MRKHGAIDSVGAEHIHVVLRGKLLWRERFRRPPHHMASTVDEHVEMAVLIHDGTNRCSDRLFILYVELDRSEIDALVLRLVGDALYRRSVLAARIARMEA